MIVIIITKKNTLLINILPIARRQSTHLHELHPFYASIKCFLLKTHCKKQTDFIKEVHPPICINVCHEMKRVQLLSFYCMIYVEV